MMEASLNTFLNNLVTAHIMFEHALLDHFFFGFIEPDRNRGTQGFFRVFRRSAGVVVDLNTSKVVAEFELLCHYYTSVKILGQLRMIMIMNDYKLLLTYAPAAGRKHNCQVMRPFCVQGRGKFYVDLKLIILVIIGYLIYFGYQHLRSKMK